MTLLDEMAEALRNIQKHNEFVNPSGFKMSATWHIADKALAKYEAAKKQEKE